MTILEAGFSMLVVHWRQAPINQCQSLIRRLGRCTTPMISTKFSDFRDLIKIARGQGWVVTQTAKSHWRFMPPNGEPPVYTSGSPSCCFWLKKVRHDLKKRGLKL